MFTKRNLVDIKKSTSKLQDLKKDLTTRVKHLKIILENVDIAEAKGLFEANFSHIYNILYESFVQTETNLRQRELSFHLVHKAHKEELESTLWILEQVLSLLPELIHRRWQLHSLGRLVSKLLHPGNSMKIRRQGIRYFLMWYQALNDNAPDYVDMMFASLVPGFQSQNVFQSQNIGSVFHDTCAQNPVTPTELLPILPPSSGEKGPDHPSKFYLEALLEYMVHTVVKLEWQDKTAYYHRCFSFLLEKFKLYYLPKICPNFDFDTSLYKPNLDLPSLRKLEQETEFVHCRVSLIIWLTNYVHQPNKKNNLDSLPPLHNVHSQSHTHHSGSHDEEQHESSHPSLDSSVSIQTNKTTTDEELAPQIVREVLYSTRDNVNFLHEIYRQAFLLNFNHAVAIRKIIAVYKDIMYGNVLELPSYALELPDDLPRGEEAADNKPIRLRNDSYLGAIHKENLLVRAGMQNVYQLFMTHAANVFLLEINPNTPKMLEEQTDACKRVLNIYRYMVMNTRMDNNTWEQLLLVLLQVTSLVLGETSPKKKSNSLGGKLAPAIFQTLIVTWIKANLNVMISRELWDKFLLVLTTLTNWEELIKEWAKTLETLTRVLARHVYNLDLTNLPLDRLNESKTKRGRKSTYNKNENNRTNNIETGHQIVCHTDSSLPDGHMISKRIKPAITRSYSETNLSGKRSPSVRHQGSKNRRSKSLDNLIPLDGESTDRTRSPSPAPSSGMESNSLKDSPIQLDVLSSEHQILEMSGESRGVICGGTIRGWLPDVAVILWRRMLGALGDINQISEPKLHSQVFEYIVKLTDTLIKINHNQGISPDNMSTPQSPELIPPLTLIVPWCFGALVLPDTYEAGKLSALRLLCTITLHCDNKPKTYLPQFYRFLHSALNSSSKLVLNTCLRYLGPRFLSLQLPGSSLLILDLIHACNTVLNNTDKLESSPRTEAVSILANLLSHPEDLSNISVLQPDQDLQVIMCPDIKEHVVSILLRTGRREPKGKARFIALSALGVFIYKELQNQTFHSKVPDAINVILLALKFNNKIIAQLASNILFSFCDHVPLLWTHYPRLGNSIISTLCSALQQFSSVTNASDKNYKALGIDLLLCLGEWCMKLSTNHLMEVAEYGENRGKCLLLQVFKVLYNIVTCKTSNEHQKVQHLSANEDFDPNILADDLNDTPSVSPSKTYQCQETIILCAKTVLTHLVTHLDHFPMAIGAARLSSLVAEQDDVPNLTSDDLSSSIFTAPNIQLFILSRNVIASLIELPTLDLPGGGVTAGLSTADKQVRVLLRDLSGKACWDASILYKTPEALNKDKNEVNIESQYEPNFSENYVQPESFIMNTPIHTLPQRAMRHRQPNVLPDTSNAAPDLDQLDDLLQYLGHTSPECLENFDRKLNEPAPPPMSVDLENEAIASVISQRNVEVEESRLSQQIDFVSGQKIIRPTSGNSTKNILCDNLLSHQAPNSLIEQASFQQCRLLFSQLGLASWERRQSLHLLNKTERLLRELRNLDNQSCRETHKFAVIYVAPGQEDKNSILSNQGGSVAYESFLASLAWEIELEGHTGFMGGLQRQGSTGLTAPYISTSFLEAIFHVSTRMPSDTPEAVLNKTRHLGNDEVHIVWSEHNRDYRRDIIPTEFCDILITIYPLGNNLNRVTVDCKPDVPNFGVLFNEAMVESAVLAGLVRATAICASRAKRMTYQYYQQYYEERARSLDTVVTKHKNSTTYEEFISKVYSPVLKSSPFCQNYALSSGSSNAGDESGNSSTLAAALLDSHSHPHKNIQRTENKFRSSANDATRTGWFHNADQNLESSISPRPMKRLSSNLKNSKKTVKHEQSVESPPESPLQMLRKK